MRTGASCSEPSDSQASSVIVLNPARSIGPIFPVYVHPHIDRLEHRNVNELPSALSQRPHARLRLDLAEPDPPEVRPLLALLDPDSSTRGLFAGAVSPVGAAGGEAEPI